MTVTARAEIRPNCPPFDLKSIKPKRGEMDGTDLLRIACQSIHEANSTNSVKDLFGRNLAAFLAGK